MNREDAIVSISIILNRIIEEKGETPVEVRDDTPLLGGDLPIDSLDVAAIVVELEQMIGFDPFKDGFIEFRTVGELAVLYSPSDIS